jgi:hypothetical protein
MPNGTIAMSLKKYLPLVVVLLSALGILVCSGGVVAVWLLASQLDRTTEYLFDGVDKSLVAVRDRTVTAQKHAEELRVTTQEIAQALRERVEGKASELVRLDIQERAGRLGQGLQQLDSWLEIATQSIASVDQGLEVLGSLGAPCAGDSVKTLIEKLASLQKHLQTATEAVTEIRTRATDLAEGPSLAERKKKLAQYAARLLLTLGEVDSHLTDFDARVADMQTNAEGLRSQTLGRIAIATYGLMALLVWLAIGQVSLCVHGWRSYRSLWLVA